MSEPAESELIEACRSGDAEAYRGLMDGHYRRVLGVCWGMLGGLHEAEDAAQEAMIRGYRRLGNLRNGAAFGPWIVQIARNVCVDVLRERKRRGELVELRELTTAPAGVEDGRDARPPAEYEGGQDGRPVIPPTPPLSKGGKGEGDAGESEALWTAIERLPMELRVPLVMYYFDGRSVRGVAESLGVSPATVCGRLREARRELHERLKGER